MLQILKEIVEVVRVALRAQHVSGSFVTRLCKFLTGFVNISWKSQFHKWQTSLVRACLNELCIAF